MRNCGSVYLIPAKENRSLPFLFVLDAVGIGPCNCSHTHFSGAFNYSFTALIYAANDLFVLGWITESLASALNLLDETNGEQTSLDIIVDRLPNEQGGEEYYKATLLKNMLQKATADRATIVGVPDPSMETQRDLFVDNVAGLASEVHNKPSSQASKYASAKDKLWGIDRTLL